MNCPTDIADAIQFMERSEKSRQSQIMTRSVNSSRCSSSQYRVFTKRARGLFLSLFFIQISRFTNALFRALHQFSAFLHVSIIEEYVPLPHVFPPSAIQQSPAGRATLGSRTLSIVPSLCHSLRWCKKQSAPATSHFCLVRRD